MNAPISETPQKNNSCTSCVPMFWATVNKKLCNALSLNVHSRSLATELVAIAQLTKHHFQPVFFARLCGFCYLGNRYTG